MITDDWYKKLNASKFHSSKYCVFIVLGKPGTGIFLMKERAKLVKAEQKRKTHTIAKKLKVVNSSEPS